MRRGEASQAIACARELVQVASRLCDEAATLAEIFDDTASREARVAAAHASVHAARLVFDLQPDGQVDGDAPLTDTLRIALASLDEASAALAAARAAVDAVAASHARGRDDAAQPDAGA